MSTNKSLLTNVVTQFVLDRYFKGELGTCTEKESSLTSLQVLGYLTDCLGEGNYSSVLEELKDYMGEDFIENVEFDSPVCPLCGGKDPITVSVLQDNKVIWEDSYPTKEVASNLIKSFSRIGNNYSYCVEA